MKRTIFLLALIFTLGSCQSPQYIYDKPNDEWLIADEYYSRYPEENPNLCTIIIAVN